MCKKIVLIGFFSEVVELCEKCGYEIVGYVDNERNDSVYQFLGNDSEFLDKMEMFLLYELFIVPDSPELREKLYNTYHNKGFRMATLISPNAIVSKSAQIGEGCMIQDGVNVSSNVVLGKCVRVNSMANCMHDVIVDDFCVIAPSAVLLGHVKVLDKAYIGANATILPEIKINGGCVGAGAVVTKDVTQEIVAGVPAKKL